MISRDSVEEVLHSDDDFAPVGYLNLKSAHLENKTEVSGVYTLIELSWFLYKLEKMYCIFLQPKEVELWNFNVQVFITSTQ